MDDPKVLAKEIFKAVANFRSLLSRYQKCASDEDQTTMREHVLQVLVGDIADFQSGHEIQTE